eukprot:TRINITY_DN178_c0_g1_i1.p2 TRINITY_DN178_c0_g1~~TRINITY_DN178_c0_g1_i1.p2  ORF type:complete len:551 (+),score=193.34 TRINITY_DN178_c0_g1_i1:197-1654(+)
MAQQQATGQPMQMAESTQASIAIMQDQQFLQKFGAPQQFQPGEVLDKLTQYFARYEVPLGMVNKLCMLSEYSINLIIDDSGSMNAQTDSNVSQAGDYMKRKLGGGTRQMTRWEEAQDRVHTIVDLLTFCPTGPLTMSFFNRQTTVQSDRQGKQPEQWAQQVHQQIDQAFASMPTGLTPTKMVLTRAFQQSRPNTMHYLFTDGQPSDTSGQRSGEDTIYPELEQLVSRRPNPQQHPLTFVSCTDQDEEANWMKVLEEHAPYCSEVDDYNDERAEVLADQGVTFPFSKGFWLVCLLASAVCPDDLDAMDDSAPFSKMTMDNMLGRVLTEQDYVAYFRAHPQEAVVRAHYQEFATAKATGKQIWKRHNLRAVPVRPGAVPPLPGAPGAPAPAGGAPPAPGYGAPPQRPPQGYSQPSAPPMPGAPGGAPGYGAPQGGAPGYPAPGGAPGYPAPGGAPGYPAPGGAPGGAPGYPAPGGGAPAGYPQPPRR